MHATKWFTAEFADDFDLVWSVMWKQGKWFLHQELPSDQREVEKFV